MPDSTRELVADEVAPGVYVATAQQYTTTTTIITGADGGCLLVDPAVSVAELGALARWLRARGLRPVAGWSTHPHWDHLLWSRELGDASRYATPRAVEVTARELPGLIAGAEESSPGHDLSVFGRLRPLAGDEVDWPGPRAVCYAHGAHAPGHGALFLPDTGVLIAGDMCSDIEIPLPDLDAADPFGGYRAGLGTLASVPGVRVVIPGHGHAGDRGEYRRRIAADFGYLDAIETGTGAADADPRLTADWLRAEHAKLSALAAVGRDGAG